ncbi:MAG: MBL fold metallo-hydrolase [Desulfovibrio sp.]|jgi:glyoxylase-like metal-dependent hydrolase (beta-lactamase superfamily II)|nr:MBL fold metallo-hydrolase [Desulfovibrio sp.]
MTQEVAPGIYRMEIPLPRTALRTLNAYLVRAAPRNLLVDTGLNMPESRDALYAGLAELGALDAGLDIFLTHMHADHSGLAAELAARPETTVYAGAEDGAAVIRLAAEGPVFWRGVLDGMAEHGCPELLMRTVATTHPGMIAGPVGDIAVSFVNEGDVLRCGEAALRVLLVPGHTPGHAALFDEARGILLCGDFVLAEASTTTPYWPNMPDSLGVFLRSLDSVRDCDIRLVLPGHGRVFDNAGARMVALRAGRARRLEDTLRLLGDMEATAAELAQQLHRSRSGGGWESYMPAQQWFAMQDMLAFLERLEAEGRVARAEKDGLIRFRAV